MVGRQLFVFLTDEVIPHLGVYQRIMQLVKQELYGKSKKVFVNDTETLIIAAA